MNISKPQFFLLIAPFVISACATAPKTNSVSKISLESCKELLQQEKRNEAAECFRPASDAGNAEAQFYLGDLYLNARAGDEADQYAEKLYRLSANQGFSKSQKALGDLYFAGLVVPNDFKLALDWYQKAASQGDLEAQDRLAQIFEEGQSVEKDHAKSLYWYTQAANQGQVSSMALLADVYLHQDHDYEKAKLWSEKAASFGDRNSRMWLAHLYENGWGVGKNEVEALKWYLLFQDLDHPDPMGRPEAAIKKASKSNLKKAQMLADNWKKTHPSQDPSKK